jgi:hypothetical protein
VIGFNLCPFLVAQEENIEKRAGTKYFNQNTPAAYIFNEGKACKKEGAQKGAHTLSS